MAIFPIFRCSALCSSFAEDCSLFYKDLVQNSIDIVREAGEGREETVSEVLLAFETPSVITLSASSVITLAAHYRNACNAKPGKYQTIWCTRCPRSVHVTTSRWERSIKTILERSELDEVNAAFTRNELA